MPRLSQLETDLMRNASDRLEQWRKDTVMRCNVVDIPVEDQISMIFTSLVGEIVRIAHFLKMDDADFGILMQQALRDWKNAIRDFENKSADVEKSP